MGETARSFRFDDGSLDTADPVAFEHFFKPVAKIGSEERLMLAILQDAVECFQQYALSECLGEKQLFQEAERWIRAKNSDWLFRLRISAQIYRSTQVILVGACDSGRKQRVLLVIMAPFVDTI